MEIKASDKVNLPPLPWSSADLNPKVDITPGKISLMCGGSLRAGGQYTDQFVSLAKEAGFNVIQSVIADFERIKNSIPTVRKYGLKFFIRFGTGRDKVNLFKYDYKKLTSQNKSEALAELQKINPNNECWNNVYNDWIGNISAFLDYSNECITQGQPDPLDTAIGCQLDDEPAVWSFWMLTNLSQKLWQLYKQKRPGVTPFLFCNLFPDTTIGDDASQKAHHLNLLSGGLNNASDYVTGYTPITSYDGYVDLYQNMLNPPVLSFDSYPFKLKDNKPVEDSMIQFFGSLVSFQNRKKRTGMDFWSTIICCKFTFKSGNTSTGEIIPSPTLGRMRFAAFISLLYGARGLSYWGVTNPTASDGDASEFPIQNNGALDESYYSIKTINTQISEFQGIIKNTTIALTSLTQDPPYTSADKIPGIKIHNSAVSFGAIVSIRTFGKGFVLSHMYNSEYNYIFVVNMDAENSQTANFKFLDKGVAVFESNPTYMLWRPISEFEITNGKSITFEPGNIRIFRYPR